MASILLTINAYCAEYACGRTKTYELLNSGALESTRVGRKRLIIRASADDLVKRNIVTNARSS